MSVLLFNFDDMGSHSDSATRDMLKYFKKVGQEPVQSEALPAVKRTSGISYREMLLTFGDSQQVIFRIKKSGDIYQVLLNGKVIPVKYQDDHEKAIAEVSKLIKGGSAKFQAAMSKIKAKLPEGIRTSAPKLEAVLIEKRDSLKMLIATVREEIASYAVTAAVV